MGHPPLPGSLLRRPDLAAVLDVLGTSGPTAFYAGGNLTLEMVAEVSMWGAPLALKDPTAGVFFPFLPSRSFFLHIFTEDSIYLRL